MLNYLYFERNTNFTKLIGMHDNYLTYFYYGQKTDLPYNDYTKISSVLKELLQKNCSYEANK